MGLKMKEYKAPTQAFLDTFSGLIPCTVIAVNKPCRGNNVGSQDELTVQVNETRGGYTAGEIIQRSAKNTPPRTQIKKNKYTRTILTGYCYT